MLKTRTTLHNLEPSQNRLAAPRRVTFTTFDSREFVGGPNSWLRRLVPRLRNAGWEVRVLFFIERGPAEQCPCYQTLAAQGVQCQAFPSTGPMFGQVRWLLQRLAEAPPSVLVVNLASAGYLASRWVRRAGIQSIGILHSDDDFYRKVQQEFVLGPPGNRVSELVCVSDYLESAVQRAGAELPVHRIPYGVPVPEESARPPDGRLRLIYVGRLVEEQKRIVAVTRALCRVTREVPGTEAVIYGNGPDRALVLRCLDEEEAGERVRLGGQVDNAEIQQRMLDAHLLVLLSDYEGLPIAMLEAMACGVVPVTLRIRSGVGQLIEPGETGLLVEDREDDFVEAVRSVARRPDRWAAMSQAARRRIEADYSDAHNARQWAQLLDAQLDAAPTRLRVVSSLQRGIKTLDFLNAAVTESNDRFENRR